MKKLWLFVAVLAALCSVNSRGVMTRVLAQNSSRVKMWVRPVSKSSPAIDAHTKLALTHIFQDVNTLVDEGPFFYNGKLSDTTLIRFGIWYNAIHHPKAFKTNKKETTTRIPLKLVSDAVLRLFNKKFTPQSIEKYRINNTYKYAYTYSHGYYYVPDYILGLSLVPVSDIKVAYSKDLYTVYGKAEVDNSAEGRGSYHFVKRKVLVKKIGKGKSEHFIVIECSPAK